VKQHKKSDRKSGHPVVPLDVQVLQTAASLENLAVASYGAAARLEVIERGNPALAEFITRTRDQHASHANAFNAAVARAGGKPQHAPDPRYATVVGRALAGQNDAAYVVSLLGSLEDLKAQSYTRYATLASPKLRSLMVSVACVEAAHRSFLLAVLKLLTAGATELIKIPAVPGELPGSLGSECFAGAFYRTADASAIDQGEVR
jgi:hypothetical protein